MECVAPEANLNFSRLSDIREGVLPDRLEYPVFVKPIRAAFSVLAFKADHERDLEQLSTLHAWDQWVMHRLISPFDHLCARYLPEAGPAHGMIIESCQVGLHYCLDGYYFRGEQRILGIVDAEMYGDTHAFMRFNYPSHISDAIRDQAAQIADRFLRAVDFRHGLFNMEFFYHPAQEELKVIEINPRMASQFSELYQRVSGINLHEICLALAHDLDPIHLTPEMVESQCASSFVFRSFDPMRQIEWPTPTQLNELKRRHPQSVLFTYRKDRRGITREFKWVSSYRYAVLYLGGSCPQDLNEKCLDASRLLGWAPPV